jgi:hypothetical protein
MARIKADPAPKANDQGRHYTPFSPQRHAQVHDPIASQSLKPASLCEILLKLG